MYLVRVDDEVGLHVLLLHLACLHQICHPRGVPPTPLPQNCVQGAQEGSNVVLHDSIRLSCVLPKPSTCSSVHLSESQLNNVGNQQESWLMPLVIACVIASFVHSEEVELSVPSMTYAIDCNKRLRKQECLSCKHSGIVQTDPVVY